MSCNLLWLREAYILVDLTGYRNTHDCKYKQFMHEEFGLVVKFRFFTRRSLHSCRSIRIQKYSRL